MTWNDLRPRLEPRLSQRTVPLPLLLPGLDLLTAPLQTLQEELTRQLGQNVLATIRSPMHVTTASATPDRERWQDNTSAPTTLDDLVARQLCLLPSMKELPPGATSLLLQGLDPRGYFLSETIPLLRESTGLESDELEALIIEIQNWVEPPGLFAKNLVECLLIQLRRRGREGQDPWVVLESGSDHLARGDLTGLAKHLGWPEARLRKAMEAIRRLDPRPGSSLVSSAPVIPEIAFDPSVEGLTVRLLHENLPRITLEQDLLVYVDQSPFQEQWQSVRHLMTALAMRLRTKLRAARILAKTQEAFLMQETAAPGPVVLEDLAHLMNCHSSTVHRAIGTTWARSPRGTILLADLLSRPLRARPSLSVAQLRNTIAEYRLKGHSDQEISRQLGIPRRTIAWHRKKLGLT